MSENSSIEDKSTLFGITRGAETIPKSKTARALRAALRARSDRREMRPVSRLVESHRSIDRASHEAAACRRLHRTRDHSGTGRSTARARYRRESDRDDAYSRRPPDKLRRAPRTRTSQAEAHDWPLGAAPRARREATVHQSR